VGKVLRMFDGLRNLVSGLGVTGQDKQASAHGCETTCSGRKLTPATGARGWAAKSTTCRAKDMTREWRSWQADDNQIEAIEAEETRLKLQAKTRKALILARLYGGAAMVLGLPGNAEQPKPRRKSGAAACATSTWCTATS
jgi:hypothetical protein